VTGCASKDATAHAHPPARSCAVTQPAWTSSIRSGVSELWSPHLSESATAIIGSDEAQLLHHRPHVVVVLVVRHAPVSIDAAHGGAIDSEGSVRRRMNHAVNH
jgi:hypothetical protein